MLFASKLAAVLLTPLGLCIALALAGCSLLAVGRRRGGLSLVLSSTLLLWLAATPLVAGLVLGALERQSPIRDATETPTADVAIVLGGALSPATPPRRMANLGDAADRIAFAAELFRAGRVGRILVSGGNVPWLAGPEAVPEAQAIRSLLISWGVPAGAIITEDLSRTTAENAREVALVWPSIGASSALLVTSAAHMPRALATFRRAGLPVSPAPTDVRAAEAPLDLLDLLPDAGSLRDTSDAAKEIAGYVIYWLRGDL